MRIWIWKQIEMWRWDADVDAVWMRMQVQEAALPIQRSSLSSMLFPLFPTSMWTCFPGFIKMVIRLLFMDFSSELWYLINCWLWHSQQENPKDQSLRIHKWVLQCCKNDFSPTGNLGGGEPIRLLVPSPTFLPFCFHLHLAWDFWALQLPESNAGWQVRVITSP